jgi:hypothetical protein
MTTQPRSAGRRGLYALAALLSLASAAPAAAAQAAQQAATPAAAAAAPKKSPVPPAAAAPAARQGAARPAQQRTAKPAAAAPEPKSPLAPELAQRLTPEQQRVYLAYREARSAFEREHRAYWRRVEAKRGVRKAKRLLGKPLDADDYIAAYPPKYAGPELPADIAEIVAEVKPPPPEQPLPTVADFLAHAKAQFGFVPRRASEPEFKRAYAIEALKVGLSKDQVVRVFALETGGAGTYDMQSGINPVTRQGRPVSSALGYAQLLHANTTGELVKHGEDFARRLTAMAEAPGTPASRAAELKAKAAILRKMLRAARTVPNEWQAHQRFAVTPAGLGIHALNLDADVGPWIQVLKLKGLKDSAARYGYADLTGAAIELMNLAGPGTGLEMMTPLGRQMPTPNFFSEGGYSRNPVVRDKTAAELLATLDQRMEVHLKKPGSIEFAKIFDEVGKK